MGSPSKRPYTVYSLILINILVYLYLSIKSGTPFKISEGQMALYGFERSTFSQGAYWQLFTNMFAHFDLAHLGYNMLFLAFFGSRAEELFNGPKTALLYLLFGALTTLTAFFYPLGTISAGASGAVFGLLGLDLVAQRGLYPSKTWTPLFYGFVFFFLAAATGFLAHLLGLVLGFIAGYILTRDWYPDEPPEEKSLLDN